MGRKKIWREAHEMNSHLLLCAKLKTAVGLSIDSDLSQKLEKVLGENQRSSISSYYVEITRKISGGDIAAWML